MRQRVGIARASTTGPKALLMADCILVFTPRPGRIAADITVDLPRPRAPQSDGFQALARELRGLVGAERDFD